MSVRRNHVTPAPDRAAAPKRRRHVRAAAEVWRPRVEGSAAIEDFLFDGLVPSPKLLGNPELVAFFEDARTALVADVRHLWSGVVRRAGTIAEDPVLVAELAAHLGFVAEAYARDGGPTTEDEHYRAVASARAELFRAAALSLTRRVNGAAAKAI